MKRPFKLVSRLGAGMPDGDVNLSHICEDEVYNTKLKGARTKVKLIPRNDWLATLNAAMTEVPSRITIGTKDGRKLEKERWRIGDSPEEPLNMEQLQGLYSKFTQGILPDEQVRKTRDAILHLEELMDMLVFRHRI